jgi:hypothetical protein
MSYKKLLPQMIGMTLVLLLLVGCGTSAATPIPPTITAVPCAGAPDASAQKLAIMTQSSNGMNVASGGVIVRAGGSVSFGSTGETKSAGFWESIDNSKYRVVFSDPQGKALALIELQGNVQWDETQCIVMGEESFIRMAVDADTWLSISKREVIQGHLVLTDEKGNKYVVLVFGPEFNGVMTKQ